MDRVKMAPFGFIIFFGFFFCRTLPGQVGGLPTSARVIELTNFKNAPLFITSVGAKFNSLGNSFRHSYLPCATTCVLPGTFTFVHYLPWAFTTYVLPGTFTFIHYLPTSFAPPQLLHLNCSTSIAPPQFFWPKFFLWPQSFFYQQNLLTQTQTQWPSF